MLLYEMFGCSACELKVRRSQDEQQRTVTFYALFKALFLKNDSDN